MSTQETNGSDRLPVRFIVDGERGAVTILCDDPGFSVKPAVSEHPMVLMLTPGQRFRVQVGHTRWVDMVQQQGTECVLTHRASGVLVGEVGITGASRPCTGCDHAEHVAGFCYRPATPVAVIGVPYAHVDEETGECICPDCGARITEEYDEVGEATTNRYAAHYANAHPAKTTRCACEVDHRDRAEG